MMEDGADEEYDFEFEEDDDGDEANADIENLYYNAKGESMGERLWQRVHES
jgi:COP9 signalosome complex subunit 2